MNRTRTTNAKGVKTVTRTGKSGRTSTKTIDAKGRVTGITKTKADGTSKTLGAGRIAARKKLSHGTSKRASAVRNKVSRLKTQRKAATASGDTAAASSAAKKVGKLKRSYYKKARAGRKARRSK